MSQDHPAYNQQQTLPESLEEFSKLNCSRQFTDPLHVAPTPDELRHLLKLLGLTGGQAAKLLGLSSGGESGSRTIRKWTGGERKMPYAAWRLLLACAGVICLDDELSRATS